MPDHLAESLRRASQDHALRFWPQLDEAGRRQLAAQLEDVDLAELQTLIRGEDAAPDWHALAARAISPPSFRLNHAHERFAPEAAIARGEQALRAGKIGAVLVAGGQGTRLGFEHPKGMYPIGPVSQRTLFQVFIDRLLALGRRYGVRIPLYLMTSPQTHEETVAFLAEHHRFGLAKEDLTIFCQGTMPAIDLKTGKLLLEAKNSLALSPDGHGGTLAALARHGCLQAAKQRGIEQLFYFQVDNPLTQICDPQFIGYHLLCGSEMSTQAVAKRDPAERVGVIVEIDGKVQILEYSDLPAEQAARRDADGSLTLWAGNTAIHVFDVAFLQRMQHTTDALPFHRAKKKVPFIDDAGQLVEPGQPNAIKFERFIFDLLPHAAHAIVVEVDPAEGFAPVKNASGEPRDTPETARAAIVALHGRWLREAGAKVADGIAVEISPQFALDAAEVKAKIKPGTAVNEPTFFGGP